MKRIVRRTKLHTLSPGSTPFRVLVTYCLFLFCGLVGAVEDRTPVDETKNAFSEGFVHIKVLRGRVEVNGWDQETIRVSGMLDEELREFIFDVDDDKARIEVKIPSKSDGWYDEGSDLKVFIPQGSDLQITAISTEIEVTQVLRGVEIGNVSGGIRVRNVGERLEIDTVSGDVQIWDARARFRVNSVSGDVEVEDALGGRLNTVSGSLRLDNAGEELHLGSISGEIEVDSPETVQIISQSVSGDIEITTHMKQDAVIELDTVSGDIRLEMSGDVNAQFDVETGAGGGIRNRLSSDEPRASKYVRNESLRFTLGNGKGEVTLSTASGDITLTP